MKKNINSIPSNSNAKNKPFKLKTVGTDIGLPNKKRSPQRDSAIPKSVANRMARRIALTSGVPTLSGMGVFVGSYFLVTKGIADIPPGITLISSAGFFLLGLIGLSYGILSASWDESPGSLIGLENIKPNIGRVRSAFKGKI